MNDKRPPYRNPLLYGYLVLVLAIFVGFLRVEEIQHDLAREAQIRQDGTCASYDQLISIIDQIVVQPTGALPEIGDAIEDPELSVFLEQYAEHADQFETRARRLLEEAECPVYE